MHETDAVVVHTNKPPAGVESHLPFGGLKLSALGSTAIGAVAEFRTQAKTVRLNYS